MAEIQPDYPPDAPFGTCPRRSRRPLVWLILALALWFAFLAGLAILYPAR